MSIVKLPPAEPDYLQPLLSFCHRRRYPNKTEIIHPGDNANSLIYILSGSVSVIYEDQDGHEIVLSYLNKGAFLGEMGLFSEDPGVLRNVLVRTRTECVMAEISYTRLHQLIEGQLKAYMKEILFALGAQLTERLQHTSQKVGHLAFLDVTGRIAGTLLELCQQPDSMTHPDGMQIQITRQELGRIVGCSREMAGRVLKNLEEQELIHVKGKTIVVLNTR